MHHPVNPVEHAERPALQPLRAGRENDPPAAIGLEPGRQRRDIGGPVLSVAIHHHHPPAGRVRMDIHQPHRDGALMAQVPPQAQDRHASQRLELQPAEVRRGVG